jgi:hypothetical protein
MKRPGDAERNAFFTTKPPRHQEKPGIEQKGTRITAPELDFSVTSCLLFTILDLNFRAFLGAFVVKIFSTAVLEIENGDAAHC